MQKEAEKNSLKACNDCKKIRKKNNVEATINEFACKMPKGKLKVRGAFKASIFAFSVAMSVNFGGIYRYIQDNPDIAVSCIKQFYDYFKEQFVLSIFSKIFNFIYDYEPYCVQV